VNGALETNSQFDTSDMCSSVEMCCQFSAIQLSRYLRESAVSLQFLLFFFKKKNIHLLNGSIVIMRFVTLACSNYQNRWSLVLNLTHMCGDKHIQKHRMWARTWGLGFRERNVCVKAAYFASSSTVTFCIKLLFVDFSQWITVLH